MKSTFAFLTRGQNIKLFMILCWAWLLRTAFGYRTVAGARAAMAKFEASADGHDLAASIVIGRLNDEIQELKARLAKFEAES